MGSLTKPIILLVVIYLLLKFVVPIVPGSAPLPSSLIFLYLMLTLSGIVIYFTMSGESKDAFWGPIQRFLTGENIGALQTAIAIVLHQRARRGVDALAARRRELEIIIAAEHAAAGRDHHGR